MIELPESVVLSRQLTKALRGKRIAGAVAGASPHKFAWYTGDPAEYGARLSGRVLGAACAVAGYVLVDLDGVTLSFHDGVNLRYLAPDAPKPVKHQLRLDFTDGSCLVATVSMYGGMEAYEGENDSPYFRAALEKPSPLTDAFDAAHFDALLRNAKPGLSAKAFLATEQRVPGLGNGVLQDILLRAHVHPTCKIDTLPEATQEALFLCVKEELKRMLDSGGRDTERDLFGVSGDYRTLRSSPACPLCGGAIVRKAYLGGNVYFCPRCQKV